MTRCPPGYPLGNWQVLNEAFASVWLSVCGGCELYPCFGSWHLLLWAGAEWVPTQWVGRARGILGSLALFLKPVNTTHDTVPLHQRHLALLEGNWVANIFADPGPPPQGFLVQSLGHAWQSVFYGCGENLRGLRCLYGSCFTSQEERSLGFISPPRTGFKHPSAVFETAGLPRSLRHNVDWRPAQPPAGLKCSKGASCPSRPCVDVERPPGARALLQPTHESSTALTSNKSHPAC